MEKEKQKQAPLSGIRGAIRDFRVIRFTYDGREYTVEPHEPGRLACGSFLLRALVREGPPGAPRGLTNFHYWKIRKLRILPELFKPRSPFGGASAAA